ncbi:unnamed protein product [Phaedon cochleariae]|uniref:Leucine-rich PPR motif-containing protein, mitochondrial n=1 Tax=Phaedon cochleariae TaxID=80249 RepID=A0A9P0GPK7_PHACE|nr:unnamed protein product [Phaedon cochleariae]
MLKLFRYTPVLCSRSSLMNNFRIPGFFSARNLSVNIDYDDKGSRLNLSELTELISEKKHVPAKLITNILGRINFEKLTVEESSFLLQCCGEFTADTTKKERDKISKMIFKGLQKCDKLNTDIYQTYINVCTDNRVPINTKELLNDVKCKPDQQLYKCLLENLCQNGNIEEAYNLLELMKNEGFFADEDIFNSLALAHAAKLGLESAETILLTMKTAHVQITNNTKASVLQGILRRGNKEDLDKFLEKYAFQLNENQLLTVLKELGLSQNISWLPEIRILYDTLTLSREFPNQLRNVCLHLVHMDRSLNAMTILENFMLGTENFGFFILEEMLHCNQKIDEIIFLAQHIPSSESNGYIIENLTGIALKHQYTDAAWKLFENLSELRPHYFWPLLLTYQQQNGELGVIQVVKKMLDKKIRPNHETLEYYVLPFCNLNDPHLLVDKIHKLGLTFKELLCPALIVLLQKGETKLAAALCDSYKVSISGGKLLNLISSSWHSSGDAESIAIILQRYCESSRVEKDLVGDFLIMSLEHCANTKDFANFNDLLKVINEKKLKMTTSSADVLCKVLDKNCEEHMSQQIRTDIDLLLDFRLKPEEQFITHPRDMTLEELECHLIELEEKNMQTRGVLRKLIGDHAKSGNDERVKQLLDRFLAAGYSETPGMKCMVMYSFVKGGHLQPALKVYNELKENDPTFSVDIFKILDLATLLVKNGRFSQAFEILQQHSKSKIFGGLLLQRNCLELLKACENEQEQAKMFNFLIEKGFCKVTNVILGPLVRIHLKDGNLQKAVSVYISFVEKYRFTPIKMEIIKEIVRSSDENLLQRVLDVTIKIHGKTSTQAVLIIALAEEGREKILRKILTLNKLPVKNELNKWSERLAKEGKVEALNTLASCCERLPKEIIDITLIYECIMKVHSTNNDCQSALKLYNSLMENEIPTSKNLEEQLCNLLRHNKCDIPEKLKINYC